MKKVVRFSPTATSRALSLPAAAAARVLLRKWLLPEALRVDIACTAEQASQRNSVKTKVSAPWCSCASCK